jgi:hypothetical protein
MIKFYLSVILLLTNVTSRLLARLTRIDKSLGRVNTIFSILDNVLQYICILLEFDSRHNAWSEHVFMPSAWLYSRLIRWKFAISRLANRSIFRASLMCCQICIISVNLINIDLCLDFWTLYWAMYIQNKIHPMETLIQTLNSCIWQTGIR